MNKKYTSKKPFTPNGRGLGCCTGCSLPFNRCRCAASQPRRGACGCTFIRPAKAPFPPAPCPPCPPSQVYYAVAFDANGGAPTPMPQAVPAGGLVQRPEDPARIGYNFLGWYPSLGFSGGAWNFDVDVVTGDRVLYAQWTPAYYTITFDANGGVPVPASQSVPYGGLVTRPVDPIKEGYVFIAWYPTPLLIGEPWAFSIHTVTENVTLYARWLHQA